MAFKCTACGASDYHIEVDPRIQDTLVLMTNSHGELEIEIQGTIKFVADLGFMNRFASCKVCHSTKQWTYSYSQLTSEKELR